MRKELEVLENHADFCKDSQLNAQIVIGMAVLAKSPKNLIPVLEQKPESDSNKKVSFNLDHKTEYHLRRLAAEFFGLTRKIATLAQLASFSLSVGDSQ